MAARKDGKPRAKRKKGKTTTGRGGGGRVVVADQTNWRTKLQQQRIKFDDPAKHVYVLHLAKTGLKGDSAKQANVTMETVRRHVKEDPDFGELCTMAEQAYADTIRKEVRRRGADGHLEPLYHAGKRQLNVLVDKDGAAILGEDGGPIFVPASVLKFSDRLLELEAKRTDEGYRDKQTIDLSGVGGVIVAPAEMTAEEWVRRQEKKNLDRLPPEGIEDIEGSPAE